MKLAHDSPARLSITHLAQDVKRLLGQKRARNFLLLSLLIHGIVLTLCAPYLLPQLSQTLGTHFNIILTQPPSAPTSALEPTINENSQHIRSGTTTEPFTESKERVAPLLAPDNAHPPTESSRDTAPTLDKQKTLQPSTPAKPQADQSSTSQSQSSATDSSFHQIQDDTQSNTRAQSQSGTTTFTNQPDSASTARVVQAPSVQSLQLALGQKVRQALQNYLAYPYIARQRGWSGKVMLGFQIDTDGKLLNIHLRKSSGYAVLDHSAISAINQVKQVSGINFGLDEITPLITIPVIFALQQG